MSELREQAINAAVKALCDASDWPDLVIYVRSGGEGIFVCGAEMELHFVPQGFMVRKCGAWRVQLQPIRQVIYYADENSLRTSVVDSVDPDFDQYHQYVKLGLQLWNKNIRDLIPPRIEDIFET